MAYAKKLHKKKRFSLVVFSIFPEHVWSIQINYFH